MKKNGILKTSNFQRERDRINTLMKNNGIYNFQINSVFFDVEIDSTRNLYSLPTKIIIDGDDYRKHTIGEINLINVKNSKEYSRILYQKRYNNTQAINIIEAEVEATKERDEILLFIKNSQRGIMKGYIQN